MHNTRSTKSLWICDKILHGYICVKTVTDCEKTFRRWHLILYDKCVNNDNVCFSILLVIPWWSKRKTCTYGFLSCQAIFFILQMEQWFSHLLCLLKPMWPKSIRPIRIKLYVFALISASFESNCSSKLLKEQSSQMKIGWKCNPRFLLELFLHWNRFGGI